MLRFAVFQQCTPLEDKTTSLRGKTHEREYYAIITPRGEILAANTKAAFDIARQAFGIRWPILEERGKR